MFDAFFQGCPLKDTLTWLDQIEDNVELASKSAKFYICKAKILQSTADSEQVLQVFESAIRHNAQVTTVHSGLRTGAPGV